MKVPIDINAGNVRLAADFVQLLVLSLDLAAHGLRHLLQVRQHRSHLGTNITMMEWGY